jgi:hypothetical protein
MWILGFAVFCLVDRPIEEKTNPGTKKQPGNCASMKTACKCGKTILNPFEVQ